jgi:hypothetical protein
LTIAAVTLQACGGGDRSATSTSTTAAVTEAPTATEAIPTTAGTTAATTAARSTSRPPAPSIVPDTVPADAAGAVRTCLDRVTPPLAFATRATEATVDRATHDCSAALAALDAVDDPSLSPEVFDLKWSINEIWNALWTLGIAVFDEVSPDEAANFEDVVTRAVARARRVGER